MENATSLSLGAEYMGMLNGHPGLYAFDGSSIGSHFLRLHYAPWHFLRFSGGIGGSHSYSDPHIDDSKAGLSFTGGAGLYSPSLFDFLTLTGGYDGYYIKAAEGDNGRTMAHLHTPYFGFIFHVGRYINFETGGLYHRFEFKEKTDKNGTALTDGKLLEQGRMYGTFTIHEGQSGAYLSVGASYALCKQYADNTNTWSDASIWAQAGIILRDPRGHAAPRHRRGDAYSTLKMRQERMAGDLYLDFDRERMLSAEEHKEPARHKNHKHDDQGSCMVGEKGNYIPVDAKEGDGRENTDENTEY